ncbi:MAG: hypothetical protein JSS04_04925 [Proteobacteria bacterium]|nr:hypothetical protein [Pseudomonadota bacterium]
MAGPPNAKAANKLSNDLGSVLPHLQLDDHGRSVLAGCRESIEALDRLEKAGLLIEATRLIAHALPAREAVWWACTCSRHTAASGTNLAAEAQVREAAEEWVRKPTDEHRRSAMKQAETAGFSSAEAWAAVGAFWSGDSMAPPEAPKVPPQPHFTGLAVAGSVALAACRGPASRREARLRRFLGSAKDIVAGGAGRIEAETV